MVSNGGTVSVGIQEGEKIKGLELQDVRLTYTNRIMQRQTLALIIQAIYLLECRADEGRDPLGQRTTLGH